MKKGILLLSALFLAMVFMTSCHKDPLYLGNAGLVKLELKKGYTTQNKGAVDAFYATVSVVYADESVVYNCKFYDPNNTGIYSNDPNEGDKLYVRKDVEFHILIETEIDGYFVSGESQQMVYSDDMEMLNVEIILRAGTTRIAIYMPNEDEIFGNYVVAYGEILEDASQMPIREAGIMAVAKSIYDTYESADAFTFDNEYSSESWITEYYYSEGRDEETSSITKFSVVLRGLEPNTRYCMRAFTFSESDTSFNYCYSRVVEFTTNGNVAHEISVVTNDADNVTIESVDVAGRVILLDGNSADSITEIGFAFDTYDNYVANSSSLEYYRNNSFLFPASETNTTDDMIVFSSSVSGLQVGATYVFRAYAIFHDQPYYGSVKMFAVPQDPSNILIQADDITSTLTTSYVDLQGNILNDAGYDFSEIGFKYKFYDAGTSAPYSVSDLTETATASLLSGRFSARVNLPIINKVMYFAPYAITTTGYEVYGELSSAVSIEPANVPSVTLEQDNMSELTTHSMVVSCNVDANGRSDCECGIVITTDTSNHAAYDTVRKVSSSSGIEEFVINGLRKGTSYTYWAYVRVVDEYITTGSYTVTTLQEGNVGPGGGVIFYADDANQFALEYYYSTDGREEEDEVPAIWGSTSGIALNTDAPSSITVSGLTNTEAIVSYHNGIGFTSEYAALVCYQLSQGGKSDWYLPTSVEMQEFLNYVENAGLSQEIYSQSGGFWTSDEQNAEYAVAFVNSNNGYSQEARAKDSQLNFVKVRRF
ncbi:MAG: hypothetical protein J6W06_10025 [Bacteroidales bacterium]|nr:hypothetical protein [Bacteroidales bacterium]